MTTNYPTDHYYENDEDCKFEILSATPANSQLSITEFYLEDPSADFCAFDYLLIDGVRYSIIAYRVKVRVPPRIAA